MLCASLLLGIKLGRHQKYDTRPLEVARLQGESSSQQAIQIKQEAASPSNERSEASLQSSTNDQKDAKEILNTTLPGGGTPQTEEKGIVVTSQESALSQKSDLPSDSCVCQGKCKSPSFKGDIASTSKSPSFKDNVASTSKSPSFKREFASTSKSPSFKGDVASTSKSPSFKDNDASTIASFSSQTSHPGVRNLSGDICLKQMPGSPDVLGKRPAASISPQAGTTQYLSAALSSPCEDVSEEPVVLNISRTVQSGTTASEVQCSASKASSSRNSSTCPPPEVLETSVCSLKKVKDEIADELQHCQGHASDAMVIRQHRKDVPVVTERAESTYDVIDLQMFLQRVKDNDFPSHSKGEEGLSEVIDASPSTSSIQSFSSPMSTGVPPASVTSYSPSFEESLVPLQIQNQQYSSSGMHPKSPVSNWYPSPLRQKSEPVSPCGSSDAGYLTGAVHSPVLLQPVQELSPTGGIDQVTVFQYSSGFLASSKHECDDLECSPIQSPAQNTSEEQRSGNSPNATEEISQRAVLPYDNLYTCPMPFTLSAHLSREVALICHSFLQQFKRGLMTDRIFSRSTELAMVNMLRPISALERESILFEVTRSMTGLAAIMRSLQNNVALSDAADYVSFILFLCYVMMIIIIIMHKTH